MRYRIGCEVYGGVTGHRVSVLKSHGEPMTFETREAAQAELPKSYTSERGVVFRYWIEEAGA